MGCFRVGKYIVKNKIGEGAFAEVRLAVHEESGEKFAVKIFNKECFPRPDFEKDIRKEIQIMTYLNHPNIVSVKNVLVTPTRIYIIMELVTGGELYDEIVRNKRLDEETSRLYFQQIVDALVYCHRRGVVHRDLKPENLLLDDQGNIKITDFGMSWMKDEISPEIQSKQLLKTQCGTPKYMAPEIILRAPDGYDGEKIDAWECGIVLYALLAGYLPFTGDDDVGVFQSVLRVEVEFPEHFSPMVRDVISMLLRKDPAQRSSLYEIRTHPWYLIDYTGNVLKESQEAWMTLPTVRDSPHRSSITGSQSAIVQADPDDIAGLAAATRKQLSMRSGRQLAVTHNTHFKETSRMSISNLRGVQNISAPKKANKARKTHVGVQLSQKLKNGTLLLNDDETGNDMILRLNPKGRPKPNLSLAGLSPFENDNTELKEVVCHSGENAFSPRKPGKAEDVTESNVLSAISKSPQSRRAPFSLKSPRRREVDDEENPTSFRDLLKSPFGAMMRSMRSGVGQERSRSNSERAANREDFSHDRKLNNLFSLSPTSISSPRAPIYPKSRNLITGQPAMHSYTHSGSKTATDSVEDFNSRTQEPPEDIFSPPSSSFRKLAAFLNKKGS
ncbi:unnamed protein product [Agarophyton chilense]|eukprot:gb/GEZJ01004628.1/.p1 GENE.gb/GEZJ01004628.1/~~gb/GEZJ01004628.1/.p1  ORF type:complete len:614 (-),score=80.18 gb/GEZJ01004628.1/:2189-4030(-)